VKILFDFRLILILYSTNAIFLKLFFRDIIYLESIIQHDEDSRAEGYPTRIRVITPNYVKFVQDSNTFESNYTQGDVSTNMVMRDNLFKMSRCIGAYLQFLVLQFR
jgi:hypothetical protein